MTPTEYLDAAKAKMGVESDYELAKRLEIPNANIPPMRRGERNVPLDVAFRLAITLELDPATVVADLESQREKNAKRRDFWTGFIRRAAVVAALACTLALNFSATSEVGQATLSGVVVSSALALLLAYWLRIIGPLCKTHRCAM
jgi:anti-sigma-K factor RskA